MARLPSSLHFCDGRTVTPTGPGSEQVVLDDANDKWMFDLVKVENRWVVRNFRIDKELSH
jgi:hypothetical protein